MISLTDWTRKRSNSTGDGGHSECCLGFMGTSGGKGEQHKRFFYMSIICMNVVRINAYRKSLKVKMNVLQPLWKLLVDMVSIHLNDHNLNAKQSNMMMMMI